MDEPSNSGTYYPENTEIKGESLLSTVLNDEVIEKMLHTHIYTYKQTDNLSLLKLAFQYTLFSLAAYFFQSMH